MGLALLGGKCATCGVVDNLEFDHIDRSLKSKNIAKMWLGPLDPLIAELKKCQLLCPLCHESKTSGEMGVPHGGGKKGKRNCKCLPCTLKAREYARSLRRNAKIKAAMRAR